MTRTRTILRNVLSNWTGFFVQVAVVFFLTPFLIERLGKEQYGVWVLATSMVGYYGLIGLGLQGGVNQYLTRYLATRDYSRMNAAASTAVFTLSGLGIVVVVCAVVVGIVAPSLFSVPHHFATELSWSVIVLGVSAGVQIALHLFSAAFVATQRYDVLNLIGIVTRLLSAAAIAILLLRGHGFLGVVTASAICDILGYLARWRLAYVMLPELRVSWRLIDRERFWELFSYSNWNFLGSIAQSIFAHTDALVIAWAMPVAALTPYALAASLSRYLERLLRPVDQVFFPVVADLHAREDIGALKRMYVRSSRIYLLLVAIVVAYSGVWAGDFFRLWVGEEFVVGPRTESTPFLFHILLIALAGRLFPGIGLQVLLGMLRVKQQSCLLLLEATVNIILSIVLVQSHGLAGVAMATVLSVLLLRTFTVPWLVQQSLGIGVMTYCLRAGLRPLLVGLILAGIAWFARSWFVPQSFLGLLSQMALAGLLSLPVILMIGMDGRDRRQFVLEPLRLSKARVVQVIGRKSV